MAYYRLYWIFFLLSRKEMTEYVKMLLAARDIPVWWGRAAHIFSWILLQGYVIFPSTFRAYDLAKIDSHSGGKDPVNWLKGEFFFIVRHVPMWVQVQSQGSLLAILKFVERLMSTFLDSGLDGARLSLEALECFIVWWDGDETMSGDLEKSSRE